MDPMLGIYMGRWDMYILIWVSGRKLTRHEVIWSISSKMFLNLSIVQTPQNEDWRGFIHEDCNLSDEQPYIENGICSIWTFQHVATVCGAEGPHSSRAVERCRSCLGKKKEVAKNLGKLSYRQNISCAKFGWIVSCCNKRLLVVSMMIRFLVSDNFKKHQKTHGGKLKKIPLNLDDRLIQDCCWILKSFVLHHFRYIKYTLSWRTPVPEFSIWPRRWKPLYQHPPARVMFKPSK